MKYKKIHTQAQRNRVKQITASKAKVPAWFKKLSPQAKLAYLELHPNSKIMKSSARVYSVIPIPPKPRKRPANTGRIVYKKRR